MIMGLGSDICNIERIEAAYCRFGKRFVTRWYGLNEQKELPSEKNEKRFVAALAKRFAAKEAFSKALGTGFRNGLVWAEIEVLHTEEGKPYISLSGKAEQMAIVKNVKNIFVSLADDYPFAQAVVVIEC